MTDQQRLIGRLEAEYDRQTGFLGQLRQGVVGAADSARFLNLVREIRVGDGPVDVRLVRFLWFTPVFLRWQMERLELSATTSSAADLATVERVLNLFEDRVGAP